MKRLSVIFEEFKEAFKLASDKLFDFLDREYYWFIPFFIICVVLLRLSSRPAKYCSWCKLERDRFGSEAKEDFYTREIYCSKECLDKALYRNNKNSKVFWIAFFVLYLLVVIYINIAKWLNGGLW